VKIASLALATVLALAPAARASAPPALEAIIGPRSLSFPAGLAVMGDNLYIDHPAEDELSVIDLRTGRLRTLASDDDASLDELVTPDDIWADPVTGDVYVTEVLVNGVRRVAQDGTRTRVLTGFGDGNEALNGVLIDAITGIRRTGEALRLFVSMYALDPSHPTGIWEIDPAGVVPPRLVYGAAFGVDLIGTGLHQPDSLEFGPDGALYASELAGGKVWAIDISSGAARLVYDPGAPVSLAVGAAFKFDPQGRIVYADYQTGRLARLDPRGTPDQRPSPVATVPPGSHSVAVHPDGRIFVSDLVTGGVAVVAPDGSVGELEPRGLNLPNGMAALADGRLAVADGAGVVLVDPDDRSFTRPWRYLIEGIDLTYGLASAGCDIYATAITKRTIQRVDACSPGAVTDVLPSNSFSLPADMVIDGDALWLSDMAGFVWRISGGSASMLPTAFNGPTGIAVGPRGLYVSEPDAGRVRVVDAVLGLPVEIIDGLHEPEGLALEADGSLLVVEAAAGRLTRVRTDGRRETVADGLETAIRGVSVIPPYNYFADVVVAADGDIYVVSPEDGSLLVIR
jgi:sugar lactone lactonase YvrE